MKILVTGSRGVVGTALVKELRKRDFDTWGLDIFHSHDPKYIKCDISEFRQLQNVLKNGDFDFVYHLAAEFGRFNGEHFYERMWKSNVIGTKNMLTLQQDLGFKMVFSSSSEVYGDYRELMTEDVPTKIPIRQLNDYAISKWVNEQQIMNSQDRHNTKTVRLRLFNSYGPGEYYSPYRSAITIFVYSALHNLKYTVFSKNVRSWTYIDDMINAIANVIKNFKPGEVYNIAGDRNETMKEISDMILKIVGRNDSIVEYKEKEDHNTFIKIADNKKAKRDLGYKTAIPLEEGLRRTAQWQRKIYLNK
jgi:dTDP-glucose 4,6-dehydratase